MARLFDEAELMERVDKDLEFLAETVEMLGTDGRELMGKVKAALGAGDGKGAGAAAHALKGMISNFCAAEVQTLAQEVESAGKAGNVEAASAAAVKLEAAVEALIVELTAFVKAAS